MKQLLGGLAQVYGETITDERFKWYVVALRHVPKEALEKAAIEWVCKQHNFPLPCQLLEMAQ
jgi:hypothetical protein